MKTTFLQFLKNTPSNLLSIVVIWAMCIAGMVMTYKTRMDFEPFWYTFMYGFMALIMFLAILRVYLIWKKQ